MIPVALQAEPIDFERLVRQPGRAWLALKGIPLDQTLASNTEFKPCWRDCLDDLYRSYGGVCAYLAVYFERATGGASVDHYIPKSKRVDLAYEWGNYRLASAIMNSRKNDYDDVLDPFEVEMDWFHLELVSGRIFPNKNLDDPLKRQIAATIERLGLDDGSNREMRARHYQDFCEELYTADFLAMRSPLVFAEAKRQRLVGRLE